MRKLSTIDLSFENQLIKNHFLKEFSDLYDSNQLISSPVIEELEHKLARFCGTQYCNLTGAGTMALELAARVVGIKPGDEVIVPANTFLASAVAMHNAGARIVLADVDPETWNLSAATVRQVITPRTKAICLVHLYGNIADPQDLSEFGIPVIEDGSHAFGGALRGKRVGSLGAAAGFSAGPIKGFGGLGHAGFVMYDQEDAHAFVTAFINNGQTSRHYAEYIGNNYRIDSINALFLSNKFSVWEQLANRKKEIMKIYDAAFGSAGVQFQKRLAEGDPVLWVYVIRMDQSIRDHVMEYLKTRCNIDTLVQYTWTINQLPIWKELAAQEAFVPVSESLTKEVISLPMHAGLSQEDAVYVSNCVIEAVQNCQSGRV